MSVGVAFPSGYLGVTCIGMIGMVPDEARKEDVIGILAGMDVPVSLRKSEDADGTFRLVGAYYVHGIMAGEALRWVQNGHSAVDTISII